MIIIGRELTEKTAKINVNKSESNNTWIISSLCD